MISNNIAREMGVFQKQSSFYFQATSCLVTVEKNIFFNGPRAGINVNDGFGGGNDVNTNLIFNMCRESGDHGPWNRYLFVKILKFRTSLVHFLKKI